MDIIHAVAAHISGMQKGHTVDLKNPERTVLIEVYKVGLTIPGTRTWLTSIESVRAGCGGGLRQVSESETLDIQFRVVRR
jgi:hypothetical protein